jgi:putative membrane protein
MEASGMVSRNHRLLALALVLVPFTVAAQADSATEMTFEGQLLNILHEANLMEIAAGRLAVARGKSAAVRQFGAELVRDHSAADDQVVVLATRMNVILPSAGAPEGDGLKQLAILSGDAFDRAFIKMMLDDHTKAISVVRSAEPRVSNMQLAAFLKKLLPTLESHRDTAIALGKAS